MFWTFKKSNKRSMIKNDNEARKGEEKCRVCDRREAIEAIMVMRKRNLKSFPTCDTCVARDALLMF